MNNLMNTKENMNQNKLKNIFRINWELIITILVAFCTFLSMSVYYNELDDWRMLILSMIPMCLLCTMLAFYNSIKEIRHEILKNW